MKTADEIKNDALRAAIDAEMSMLTERQCKLIYRIHDNAPWKGLANCPPEKLDETYELIRRTSM